MDRFMSDENLQAAIVATNALQAAAFDEEFINLIRQHFTDLVMIQKVRAGVFSASEGKKSLIKRIISWCSF